MISPIRAVTCFVVALAIGVCASSVTTFAQDPDPFATTTTATPVTTATTVTTSVPVTTVVATTTPIPLSTTTTGPPTSIAPPVTNPAEPGVIQLTTTTTTTVVETPTVVPTSTTTDPTATTTSSSTTVDPLTTTSVPIVDNPFDDATPEPVPNPGFKPTLPAINIAPIRNITLENLLFKLTAEQRVAVAKAQAEADRAQERVGAATIELDELDSRQASLRAELIVLKQKADVSRAAIRTRGLRVYSGSNVAELDSLLRSEDSSTLARRFELLRQAQRIEAEIIKGYETEQAEVERTLDELTDLTVAKKKELETVLDNERALNDALVKIQASFAAASQGLAIAVNGWVFPVQPPFSFVDTFGAPRMFGTKYAHTHQGTDIFATSGTPLRAVSRGVIARKGQAVLGGNKLWLVGADGTQYYYAHLSAFVEGVDDGTVVEAGQVIGFVGNTGNALTTPAHVHFEIHPGGGPAMNPFPTLDAVRRSDSNALVQAQKLQISIGTAGNLPSGTYRAGIGVTREFAIGAVDASAAGTRSTLPVGVTIPAPVRRADGLPTSTLSRSPTTKKR